MKSLEDSAANFSLGYLESVVGQMRLDSIRELTAFCHILVCGSEFLVAEGQKCRLAVFPLLVQVDVRVERVSSLVKNVITKSVITVRLREGGGYYEQMYVHVPREEGWRIVDWQCRVVADV